MGKRGNGEGTIYQRDGSWVAAYTDSAGKRRELWAKTRGDVAARPDRRAARAEQGRARSRREGHAR